MISLDYNSQRVLEKYQELNSRIGVIQASKTNLRAKCLSLSDELSGISFTDELDLAYSSSPRHTLVESLINSPQCQKISADLDPSASQPFPLNLQLLNLLLDHGVLSSLLRAANAYTKWPQLIWHVVFHTKNVDSTEISDVWHYDNHYQRHMHKSITYLNGASCISGGTDCVDEMLSTAFSHITNYIGLIDQRPDFTDFLANYNSCIDSHHSDLSFTPYRPSSDGDTLFFSPASVLHRGVSPSIGTRFTMSVSYIPTPPSSALSLDDCLSSSLSILKHRISADANSDLSLLSDPIPFYRSDSIVESSLVSLFSENYFTKDAITVLFQQALATAGFESSTLAYSNYLSMIVELPNNELPTSLEQVREFLLSCIQGLTKVSHIRIKLSVALDTVLANATNSILAYSTPKNATFWPDPTHTKYKSDISDCNLAVNPTPLLDKSTPIATFGSCFAFQISKHLQIRGYTLPYYENELNKPAVINPQRDQLRAETHIPNIQTFNADYGLLFNTPSFLQLVKRAFDLDCPPSLLVKDEVASVLSDPFRENIFFTNESDYFNEKPFHSGALKALLTSSKVFIFTLGLNECWRYSPTGHILSRNPRGLISSLCEPLTLSVDDNIDAIRQAFMIIKEHNPFAKLILTVSPVPFLATTRGFSQHVVTANCHSKSVLRVAAEMLSASDEDIHYFPSYEQIMYVCSNPWQPDLRHVTETAISSNIDLFLRCYES